MSPHRTWRRVYGIPASQSFQACCPYLPASPGLEEVLVRSLAVQIAVMHQHAEPQRQGLTPLHENPAWLSLGERLPPERVHHQESVVSGVKPGAAEVLRIGHEH